jgi:hypothetical protein
MNGRQSLTAMILLAAAAAAGCGDATSARETPDSAPLRTSTAPTAPRGAAAASLPRDASGIVEASFDDLRFPMEKSETFAEAMLTDRVKSMFGERIRIRGYMYPTNRKRGLKQFVLVRDNLECCFGPGAALFDCVLVSMREGVTAEYVLRPIAVEGQFRFEPLVGPDGQTLAVFQLQGEAVK